jgi:hypothetical protein
VGALKKEERMKNGQNLSIFVLVDALGWKYIEGRNFLNDILTYRQPMTTVLGFSSGAIPAMLTGVPPAVNGHWNLFYYDPQHSPFRWVHHLRFLPEPILDSRLSRKLLKEIGRRLLGLGPLFECCVSPQLLPYFNWVERKNIFDRGGIAGAPSIFDRMAADSIPFRVYTYHHFTDAEILRQAEEDIRGGAASFYFLYLSEMDRFLHMNCTQPDQIEQRLRWYDRGLRKVFQAARQVDSTATLTIVSDHGMTPVSQYYNLLKEIERLEFCMPDDYLAVYDSTMARYWFFDERARRGIVNILQNLPCGRVLSETELQRLGVFFSDRRYGEVVFLLDPGWLFSKSDFSGVSWKPSGMHGYHPSDPYSDAVYLSNRKPDVPLQSVQDTYTCMIESIRRGGS